MNSRSSCSNVFWQILKFSLYKQRPINRLTANKLKTHLFLNSSPHLSLQTAPAAETRVLPIQTLRPMHSHSHHLSAGNPSKLHAVRVVYLSKIKAHLMSELLLALKIQRGAGWTLLFCSNNSFWRKLIKGRVTRFPVAKLNTNSLEKEPYVTSPRRNNWNILKMYHQEKNVIFLLCFNKVAKSCNVGLEASRKFYLEQLSHLELRIHLRKLVSSSVTSSTNYFCSK